MPTWKLHLYIANEICKQENIKDKTTFLLANLAPDIKTGWMLPEVKMKKSAAETHFYNGKDIGQTLPDVNLFVKSNKLKDIVSIGYCTHLLTDYYWNSLMNNEFFLLSAEGNIIGIKTTVGCLYGTTEMCNTVKRNDFLYASDYVLYDSILKTSDVNLKNLRVFKEEFDISLDDLRSSINYIDENYRKVNQLRYPMLMSITDYLEHLSLCKEFVWRAITEMINEFELSTYIEKTMCS